MVLALLVVEAAAVVLVACLFSSCQLSYHHLHRHRLVIRALHSYHLRHLDRI